MGLQIRRRASRMSRFLALVILLGGAPGVLGEEAPEYEMTTFQLVFVVRNPDCDLADDAKIMREIAEKGADLMSVFDDSTETE